MAWTIAQWRARATDNPLTIAGRGCGIAASGHFFQEQAMLTREMISNPHFLETFQDHPEQPRWSADSIQSSLDDTLALRKEKGAVWIFGYGSLVWNPLIEHSAMERAVLRGWHRSFCLKLLDGRATRERPGRMLGLVAGGETTGFAFRVEQHNLNQELRLVWLREMVHGLYRPQWEEVRLASGRTVRALAFVAENRHPLFQQDASVATAAENIAHACGPLGSNRQYLIRLEASLAGHGIHDDYISEVARAVCMGVER
ncbi:gamma-glutamylcyclotransferase [Stenotrophomonas sp.]|uniref:gamma-glutamylcyclotransferase n=1 Tax=Stenotrophomonas sp. TaxID=69392 RepID=UPI0028AA65DA|nr:gamma-glutamylcyclotransferase [Stenotrophomonas sp.]